MKILGDSMLVSDDEKVRIRLDAIKVVEVQGSDVVVYLDREWYYRLDSSAAPGRAEKDASWIVEQIAKFHAGDGFQTFDNVSWGYDG